MVFADIVNKANRANGKVMVKRDTVVVFTS